MIINSSSGTELFVSWSGGKDAYLSLVKMLERGFSIKALLCFISPEGESRSHGLKKTIIERQAEMLDIALDTEEVTWESYHEGFRRAVERLKRQGMKGGVFGDINLEDHRLWVEEACLECGIESNLPLWGTDEAMLLKDLIQRQAEMVIVSVRNDLVSEDWLGEKIDCSYLKYCEEKQLSPCGENGEIHTLVVNGPFFRAPLQYNLVGVERFENYSRLVIS